MKKLFTIILVLAVFASFGQRTGIQADRMLSVPSIGLEKDAHLDTILPGNWASATGAVTYTWEDMGYIFGTNGYDDAGYGQRFDVDEPYEIVKAIFWIGAKAGTTGDVVFTIWDYSGSAPGDVLGSVTVSMADITAAENFADALVVEFDEPIMVTGNYLLGADISGLDAWADGSYGLGNVSSNEDNGTQLGYAYVLEGTSWVPVLNYDVDVDIAIFPLVQSAGPSETYTVTFTVDMTGAIAPGGDDPDVTFDPELHNVFVTGDFRDWAQPGSEGSLQLAPVAGKSRATILEEGFEGETFPPTGWLNVDANDDGQSWFHYAVEGSAHTGEKSASSASWTQSTGPITPDNWLVTPAINVANDDYFLEYYVGAQDPDWPAEKYGVFISTTGTNVEDFTLEFSETLTNGDWLLREIDLSAFVGETIYIAFRHYDCNDNFYIKIDDVLVTGTPGGNGGDEIFYTGVANDVAAGQILYKYFIVEKDGDPTWDLGEWIGDPDRSVMVEGDLVLNDIWADPTVSVDEIMLDMVTRVYPNPVRNTLFIQSEQQIDHLRMFDLAGRLVFQTEVMDFETTIDASQLRGGLYILQMISGQQVKTHKIQVVK